jgi:hypothetical protein
MTNDKWKMGVKHIQRCAQIFRFPFSIFHLSFLFFFPIYLISACIDLNCGESAVRIISNNAISSVE